MYSGTVRNVGSLSRRRFNGKRKPVILTFTASATWKVPKGVTKVDVFLVGGGGRGGYGWKEYDQYSRGGGGGGGGNVVVMQNISVVPESSISIVIGASEGQTSFGSFTALAGTNGTNASSGDAGTGGNGNSGGGGGSYYNNHSNGGIQANSSGYRLVNSIGNVDLKDFNGVFYGNGGGQGGYWKDNYIYVLAGTAGSGAGSGGSHLGGSGGIGGANSGGGGGGGGAHFSGTAGAGGAGGSGLVQIRYWKE